MFEQLPINNPHFTSLNIQEKRKVISAFIEEYEQLVEAKRASNKNSDRYLLREKIEKYKEQWESNFEEGIENKQLFGWDDFFKLRLRFYMLAGASTYRRAKNYCHDLIRDQQAEYLHYCYVVDAGYQFGLDDVGKITQARLVDWISIYHSAFVHAQTDIAKRYVGSSVREFRRYIGRVRSDLVIFLEETLVSGLATNYEFCSETTILANHEPIIPAQPVSEVCRDVQFCDSGKQKVCSSDDLSIRSEFLEFWKTVRIAIITSETWVKTVNKLKAKSFFRNLWFENDRSIDAYDSFKEKNKSVFDFLTYDIVLVWENDHTFKDMNAKSKWASVVTFLREEQWGKQIILELRRWAKSPKTDQSVLLDKINEAQQALYDLYLKDRVLRM